MDGVIDIGWLLDGSCGLVGTHLHPTPLDSGFRRNDDDVGSDGGGDANDDGGVTLHTMLTTGDELLHVGVSRATITPPVGFAICGPEFPDRSSRGIDDDLFVKCIVFKSYGETAAIVSLDVYGVAESLVSRITEAVEDLTGIGRDRVLVLGTGNGTSPPLWLEVSAQYGKYVGYLPDVVAGCVLDASLNLEAAAVGTVSASLPNLSCFAKPVEDETLEVERERLMLTVVQTEDGRFKCVLCNFACPATIVGDSGFWTADYPGVASAALEDAGVDVAIFVQGACADVQPFDWWDGNDEISHAERIWSDAQAFGILMATQSIRAVPNVVARRNARVGIKSSDDGSMAVVRIGDAVLISSRRNHSVGFAAGLRKSMPGSKLLVSAESSGANGGVCAGWKDEDIVLAARLAKRLD